MPSRQAVEDTAVGRPHDQRAAVRADDNDAALMAAIDEAIARKPRGHDFIIDRRRRAPSVSRHMSVTRG